MFGKKKKARKSKRRYDSDGDLIKESEYDLDAEMVD